MPRNTSQLRREGCAGETGPPPAAAQKAAEGRGHMRVHHMRSREVPVAVLCALSGVAPLMPHRHPKLLGLLAFSSHFSRPVSFLLFAKTAKLQTRSEGE